MHSTMDKKIFLNGFETLRAKLVSSAACINQHEKLLSEEWTEELQKETLGVLAHALLQPELTIPVADGFNQLLLPLLLESSSSSSQPSKHHQLTSIALAKLIDRTGVFKYALSYYQHKPAPWIIVESDTKKPKGKKQKTEDEFSDLHLLEACHKFLQFAASHFRQCWDWSALVETSFNHKDLYVRWLSCQCAALISGMSEDDKFMLVKKYLKNSEIFECKVRYSSYKLNIDIDEDTTKPTIEGDEDCSETETVAVRNWTESAISVMGVTMPVFDSTLQKNEGVGLVHVPSTLANLKNVALAVASGKPICLSGPVGCGKTALIDHLAAITGRTKVPHLLKVQLGEETDAKLLLGGYKCSDLPGEFIWQSGALTQAVTEGHWLVLEDIDTASSDVAAVLLSLLETGSLSVPGFKDGLSISPGFQIFFTYRTLKTQSGDHRKHTPSIDLLNKLWAPVAVEALSEDELVQIVQSRFPALTTVASRMVAVFGMFTTGNQDGGDEVYELVRSSGRLTSVRDLLKWCVRAESGFDVTSQESALKVLQDAIDIFCCSIADTDKRIHVAGLIAAKLGIIKTNAEHFLTTYKASIDFTAATCTAGRGVIEVKQSTEAVQLHSWQSRFALTRPSCCLLERLTVCLSRAEPVLLVGETGTGKTSTLQLLARQAGRKLVVLNMNQQSDSADLLGGYKPVDMKHIMSPIRDQFETNFRAFFNVEQNIKFLEHISTCFNGGRWQTLLRLMKHSQTAAVSRLQSAAEGGGAKSQLLADWLKVGDTLYRLEQQLKQGHAALAFSFIEGALVKALKLGYWVLLDEINLAAAETLQCLCSLLEGDSGSVTLLEQGELTAVPRHPDFRLMAAMNPATDVGKKELAPGIRNRFTELFVDEVCDRTDLCLLVGVYLPDLSPTKVDAVVRFYLKARQEATRVLADTSGHKPHYSLRTLCRALSVAAKDQCGSMQRSLYEALCLSFLTQLDSSSHKYLQSMIAEAVVGKEDIKSLLGQKIPEPSPANSHTNFVGYWVAKGPCEPNISSKYILTASVKRNLHDVVRVVSLSSDPLLIQGDTSVGKTSLISYLADASGNTCTRINNHEHTDLQEYIGAYSPDPVSGNLVFKEGVLVEAMRKGNWIILDELNLAPTDVLEALNRVLDDNRELYIPETQETVKADPKFRLFATQNPPGLYGGRKMLSRAFRNRFVELHFDEIPPLELEVILQKRCEMPSSYCKKLVAVMTDLQMRRRGSAAFAGKQGFITLRDLFRWGERYRLATQNETAKFYDWDQHLADEGFLVLAGRVRKEEERQTIIDVINKHLKRIVDMQKLFTLNENTSFVTKHILESIMNVELPEGFKHIVWTYNLRRIAVVLGKAFEFNEPALLVGETGCGKTTVIQVLVAVRNQQLKMINCHQNSESADFLGGLRPVRDSSAKLQDGKLFEWVDGPLVEAMRSGHAFLADELSLADDSVLERMNSLLEPERKLLLTEKGSGEQEVVADVKFQFAGTMNPGGDFGKKELSPALRNRLTEIWCDTVSSSDDTVAIIEHNIRSGLALSNQQDASSGIGRSIVDFIDWFKATDIGKRFSFSIRDILTWVNFINTSANWEKHVKKQQSCDPVKKLASAYIFGACVVCVDGLGTGTIESREVVQSFQKRCLEFLVGQMETITGLDLKEFADVNYMPSMVISNDLFAMGPVSIPRGATSLKEDPKYLMYADTVKRNLWRVMRSLQLPERAVLLEGSPGVGKTSLIMNLARLTGNTLTRINLSEQTDVSDLFGADLPVEGAAGGVFEWRDGPFLRALKSGHWILLDELNLASQAILESLNAVLDHRGELFVPELGKTFQVKTRQTKLFACQNPQRQGGARKGLPKSFLNRFTKVYVEPFTEKDLKFILKCVHRLPPSLVEKMVQFSCELERQCSNFRGGPWEMNLRDLARWAEAARDDLRQIASYARLIYVDRMRTEADRSQVIELYNSILGDEYPFPVHEGGFYTARTAVLFKGIAVEKAKREDDATCCLTDYVDQKDHLLVLNSQLPILQSLAACVKNNWMTIVVGGKGSGKTSVVHVFSQLCGRRLWVLGVNSATDTSDILGGFEQADLDRRLDSVSATVEKLLKKRVQCMLLSEAPESQSKACRMLGLWARYLNKGKTTSDTSGHHQTLADASQEFSMRVVALIKVVNCLDALEISGGVKRDLSLLSACSRKREGDAQSGGGTFEWVDSLLIKCLREGRWLLVDNANLCSPAVLDRLNGLLEPNGELVLGERGVSANGNLYTIKPHPNFRLFITVDPKYGEISRAMRNRGVEIFMTTNRSGILGNQHFEEMDLYALMTKCGLKMRKHQDVLIKIHQTVVSNTYGSDDFTISQLLTAASLIVQLHSYGVPLRKSFKIGCNDVYLKNLNVDLLRKEKIAATIEQLFNDFSSSTTLDIRDFYFQTMTTHDVQNDCDTTMASRQLLAIKAPLEAFRFLLSNEKKSNLQVGQTFEMSQISELRVRSLVGSNFSSPLLEDGSSNLEMKVIDLLPNLLLNVFSSSSKTSYDYVGRIITTLVEKLDVVSSDSSVKSLTGYIRRVVEKSVEALGELLKDLKFTDCGAGVSLKGSPWDGRRLLLRMKSEGNDDSKWSSENRVFALLYFIVRRASLERFSTKEEDEEEGVRSLKIDTMTVLDYSEALKEGWLTDMVSNEPLISQFGALLSAVDDCVMLVLKSASTSLPTKRMLNFLSALEWRFRLEESGKMVLFDVPESTQCLPQVSQNARMMLTMHYKWLDKTLLPMLVEMIDKDSSLYSSQQANALVSLLGEIEVSLKNEFTSPLLSLTKPVRGICGQSLPLTDTNLVEGSFIVERLEDNLNLSGKIARRSELVRKVDFNLTAEGRRCRLLLVDARSAIMNGHKKELSKALEEAENVMNSVETTETQREESKLRKRTTKVSPEIKLLPVNDLLALRMNAAVRLYLLKNLNCKIDDNDDAMDVDDEESDDGLLCSLSDSFRNWTKWLQSSPAELSAHMSPATSIGNRQKLLSLLLEQFSSSPAVKRTNLWLSWGDTNDVEDFDDYFKDDEELFNPTSPLLSYFIAVLAFPDSGLGLEIDSLRGHQQRVALLNALKTTLWRNVATLSCRSLDYARNEEMCVRNALNNFSQALQKSLIDKGYIKSVVDDDSDDLSMETDVDDDVLVIKQITEGLESLYKQKEEKKVWRKKGITTKSPVESIPSMLNGAKSTLDRVNTADSNTDKWLLLGSSWTYLGLAQLIVFSCVEAVDPVQKSGMKLGYIKREKQFLEQTICVEVVQACNSGATDYVFREEFGDVRRELFKKVEKLVRNAAVRPVPPMYNNLVKDFFHLTQNICSVTRVEALMENLNSKTNVDNVLKETALWFRSVQTFTAKFESDYGTWYPDVIGPILSAITQIKYGVRLMMCGLVKCLGENDFLNSKLELLGKFPLTSRLQVLELVDVCTSRGMVDLLKRAAEVEASSGEGGREGRNATFRLAKFCLQEMHNIVQIKGDLSDDWYNICGILDHVVSAWEQQEQEKKNKILAEESLYINKVRMRGEMPTEDEETEEEISAFFNPNRESDFGDLEPAPLEGRKSADVSDKEGQDSADQEARMIKLTVKDLQEIHRIHSDMVQNNTVTHWRQLDLKHHHHHQPALNFLGPYQERFAVFKLLLTKFCTSCDVSLDYSVGAGLCVATDIASRAGHIQDTDSEVQNFGTSDGQNFGNKRRQRQYDFYNDAHIAESRQCLSLLKSLMDRVQQLMQEWPDHPTLNQIVVLVERIMSFDASSAVARFLTGLELVLTKVREWEENAHSGVSLANHMSAMVRQVIAWRKLELSCWKGCLFATRNRLKGEVSKWWFHLYALVAAFLKTKSSSSSLQSDSESEKVGECELVKALHSFMEKSTLVEFGPRLELLLTFHCHCSNMTDPGHCEATSIFWNSYLYYKQFESVVESRIKELGAPVEKKLADFVKIARWNEITYWSVKETVQKTHRTLHKYIKEYEGVLNESVLGALVRLDFAGDKKVSETKFEVNPAHYVTVNPVKANDFGLEVFIMGAEMSILKKACKFSKLTIQKMKYGELISAIDDLVGEIVKTTQELSVLEVDRSLTKEKQRSQAKSYLQQKRKALTDLFRVLSDIGLSYRTGLVVCPDESTVLEAQFVVAPLNIEEALKQIDKRDADKDLLAIWNAGGDKHFWHAIARTAQLKKTLRKPHKEIGPPIIERCKGFTNHLMKITVDEKKSLTETMTHLYQMRCYTMLLGKDVHYTDYKHTEVLIHCQHELQNLLNDCVYCLEQLKVLLDACPVEKTSVSEGETLLSNTMLDPSLLGPMILANKGDIVWSSVLGKIDLQISSAKSIVERIERANRFEKFSETLKRTNPRDLSEEDGSNIPSFLTRDKFGALKDSVPKLTKLVADLVEIRRMFDLKVSSTVSKSPFVDFLTRLTEKFQTILDKIAAHAESGQPSVPSAREQLKLINKQTLEEFANRTDDCTSSILIAIQELYKKYGKSSAGVEEKTKQSTDLDQSEESSLEENHLKMKVVENIGEDIKKLNLAAVTNCIEELLEELALMEGHDGIACKSLLERCCPLFDQYLLLAQFVITHQLSAFRVSSKLCSVLSSLFVNLSQKGFCTPDDLADELEEEGGEGEAKGGMGLGEGEGQKDVSDQIESEDQLEDARPKGEQRGDEEEEKECREEEKGIEMSEDFGGKLQDLEKDEDEEEKDDDDDSEEEADKEMGETEKGAETLDQEIWGSDSDDEEGERDESEEKKRKEEEDGDKGERMGEKEWGAKDEGKEPTGDDDKNERKDEEREEEINEMEEEKGDDNQVDPYHGKDQQQVEPEEFDLPEDLNLDEGEAKDGEEEEEGDEDKENPFDVDNMKDRGGEEEEEEEKGGEEKNVGEEEEEEENGGGDDDEFKLNLDDESKDDDEEGQENVDEGGKKDEQKTGEEEKERNVDEGGEEEEQAKPSEDAPATEQTESAQQTPAGSTDEVTAAEERQQTNPDAAAEKQDAGASEGPDQEGVGQAEQDEKAAGHGGVAKQTQRDPLKSTGRDEKRQRPGESDDRHTLGDLKEPVKKKVKTLDAEEEEEDRRMEEGGEDLEEKEKVEDSDFYQHITDASKSKQDVEVVDAATKEQFEKQNVTGNEEGMEDDEEEEEEEEVICLEDDDVEMVGEELLATKGDEEEKEDRRKEKKKNDEGKKGDGTENVVESKMETSGKVVETVGVARGTESTFHTKLDQLDVSAGAGAGMGLSEVRSSLEDRMGSWLQAPATDEATEVWARLNGVVTSLAAELSEQLRLVLEPTTASRLKGDFRTGRRINMRKVIPYIASQFRKDKIWLRRTKPAKRDYQVVLAIDDSSSMSDNHSKQLAFESLALVSKALTLLDVGQLCVVSFGEKPKVLHPLSEPFTEHSGAKLMQQLLFDQQKTQVGSLLEFACDMLTQHAASSRTGQAAQLLVIVSDGRGVMDEGEVRVRAAVRRARLQNVFTVFVVIDSPSNKDSILDIRMPKFVDGKLLGISSYMDSFPFPFYLILRDINGLPMVLSDALRQWFELVTNLV